MFYIHQDKTKLFPKSRIILLVWFLGEKEPNKFEVDAEEVVKLDQFKEKWYISKDGYRINMHNINIYKFDTEVWIKTQQNTFSWASITDRLLERIMSDEGQAVLLKREMNIG